MYSIIKKITLVTTALFIAASLTSLHAAPTRRPVIGKTTVIYSDAFVGAAGALKLTVTPVYPAFGATITPSTKTGLPAKFRHALFPITGGALNFATAAGEIIHTGGLSIRGGATVVALTDFVIDTSAEIPQLTGLVTVNGNFLARVPLFELKLPALTLPLRSTHLKLGNVQLLLTQEAADALNSVYNVTAFTAGIPIGAAQVDGIFGLGL